MTPHCMLLLGLLAAAHLAHAEPAKTTGTLQDPAPVADTLRVIKTPRRHSENPATQAAWRALAAGDLDSAQRDFERVRKTHPTDADALIGLAHLAGYQGNIPLAQRYLLNTLDLYPKHPHAQAALASLSAATDPGTQESQLKTLLAAHPNTAQIHTALGAVYARDQRWSDAQAAFFNAWSIDPSNPDHQYNLAVALDHLQRSELALPHYQGALAQARGRAVAFDLKAAQRRIDTLTPKP